MLLNCLNTDTKGSVVKPHKELQKILAQDTNKGQYVPDKCY